MTNDKEINTLRDIHKCDRVEQNLCCVVSRVKPSDGSEVAFYSLMAVV